MTTDITYKASISNDLKEMKRILIDLSDFLKSHRIPDKLLYIVNLAIEEPLGIIISYGSKGDLPLTIQVEVKIHPKSILILIVDNGRTFNPLSVPHLDLRKAAIDRPAKELSMHLVRNIMESMWYERKDGKNIFQIQLER